MSEYTPGPFSSAHLYLQWGGVLPGGDDWSCGLRIAPTGGTAIAYSDAMLTACAAAVAAFHANGELSPRALLQFTKLNVIGTDGRYTEEVTHEHVHANVGGGGLDTRTPPNQVALAISLTTGVSRGPAHRGRFYMPLPAIQVASDGLIPTDARDVVVIAAQGFLASLNAAQPAGQSVAVMSRKLGSAAHRPVTGIQVGRVLDTQRRRRNKLAESYTG
jgi:hypothetical protein